MHKTIGETADSVYQQKIFICMRAFKIEKTHRCLHYKKEKMRVFLMYIQCIQGSKKGAFKILDRSNLRHCAWEILGCLR